MLMFATGGIRFELRQENDPNTSDRIIHYIHLEVSPSTQILSVTSGLIQNQSIPLSLRAMFDQYFQLGHRLRKHYLSPRVIFCLFTGRFVPPIHRRNLYSMQYSMLPDVRPSLLQVWSELTQPRKSGSGGSSSGSGGSGVSGVMKASGLGLGFGEGRRRGYR